MKENLDRLVTELHNHGLSQVALQLEAFLKLATDQQRLAMHQSVSAYYWAHRYTMLGPIKEKAHV